jgi:hypothetical protein
MTTAEERAMKMRLRERNPRSTAFESPFSASSERMPYVENWQGIPGEMHRYATPEDDFLQNILYRRMGRGQPVPPWAEGVPVEMTDEFGVFPFDKYLQARQNPSYFIPRPPTFGPTRQDFSYDIPF